MRNDGERPLCELADLKFRNGQIVRAVDPRKYRWSIGDHRYPPDYGFDIVAYQVAKP